MPIHGPYAPPKCKIGETFHDLQHGEVVIVGKRNRWPLHKAPLHKGRNIQEPIPILTSTLVKAILNESARVIAEDWGVSMCSVRHWREFVANSKKDIEIHLAILKKDPDSLKERFNLVL